MKINTNVKINFVSCRGGDQAICLFCNKCVHTTKTYDINTVKGHCYTGKETRCYLFRKYGLYYADRIYMCNTCSNIHNKRTLKVNQESKLTLTPILYPKHLIKALNPLFNKAENNKPKLDPYGKEILNGKFYPHGIQYKYISNKQCKTFTRLNKLEIRELGHLCKIKAEYVFLFFFYWAQDQSYR